MDNRNDKPTSFRCTKSVVFPSEATPFVKGKSYWKVAEDEKYICMEGWGRGGRLNVNFLRAVFHAYFAPAGEYSVSWRAQTMDVIAFRKVKEPYGWLGNMSPHPVEHGAAWRTTEALFQALRFANVAIQDEIRAQKSPMGAKMVAKKHADKMIVVPRSEQDLANMRMVLRLKAEQHPQLLNELMATGDADLIEDTTKRNDTFWGAQLVAGEWKGKNMLGQLWMELRAEYRAKP